MSIRRSFLVWLAFMLAAVGIVSAGASYVLMRYETDNFLDSQLRQIAHYVGDAPREPLHSAPSDPLYDPEDDFVVQVWGQDRAKIYDSDPDIAIPRQVTTGFSDIAAGSKTWRTYAFSTPGRTVQISQDMVVREELAAGAALRSALPVAISFPLSWLLLTLVIDRIMSRLRAVTALVEQQDVATPQPVPLDDVPLEVRPLVHAMNGLVDRLRLAMDRQRRFVSDAAHELRTPLAALALQIGNLSRVARGRVLLARLRDAEAGARRANHVVAQLLHLAHYESSQQPEARDSVDLSVLVASCVDEVRPFADDKDIRLSLSLGDRVRVLGRSSELRVLVSSILDNAIKYSPRGGAVDIETSNGAGHSVLSVTDTGPGIPAAMRERVFERFVRATDAETEGSGLGLAIVRSIASRHNMTIELVNRADPGGLTVRVEAMGI